MRNALSAVLMAAVVLPALAGLTAAQAAPSKAVQTTYYATKDKVKVGSAEVGWEYFSCTGERFLSGRKTRFFTQVTENCAAGDARTTTGAPKGSGTPR